jgi:hypothetical protein
MMFHGGSLVNFESKNNTTPIYLDLYRPGRFQPLLVEGADMPALIVLELAENQFRSTSLPICSDDGI